MEIDWKEAEKLTKPVPTFEELVKRLLEVLSYDFVRKTYDHSMEEACEYAARLLGSDPKKRYEEYSKKVNKVFNQLHALNVKSYSEFYIL